MKEGPAPPAVFPFDLGVRDGIPREVAFRVAPADRPRARRPPTKAPGRFLFRPLVPLAPRSEVRAVTGAEPPPPPAPAASNMGRMAAGERGRHEDRRQAR